MMLAVLSIGAADAQTKRVMLRDAADNILDSFVSIRGAYDAIPEPMSQAYAITIRQTSGTWRGDSYPIRFGKKAGASAAHTITIRPDTPAKTVAINFISRTDTAEIFVFDGASWVVIDGQGPDEEWPQVIRLRGRSVGTTTLASFPAVRFINGAAHNTLRYLEGSNGWKIAGAPVNASVILFDTTATGSGNSDNVIEHGVFSGDLSIHSRGSDAHPNERNIIRKNRFEPVQTTGIEIAAGTAATEISGNAFWPDFGGTGAIELIGIRFLKDTTRITANSFVMVSSQYSDTSALTGVEMNPSTALAPGAVCLVSNNYFSNGGSYINGKLAASGQAPVDSFRRRMSCIDIQTGAGPVHAVIAHNTIRLMPTIAPKTARVLRSAALRIRGVNTGGSIALLNNIFHNERSGGAAGSAHATLDIADTTGISLDYNSLLGVDSLVRIGGRGYGSFAAYRAAYPLLDAHSDDSAVLFETPDSHYLSARMKGRPEILGLLTPAVTADKDGNPRQTGYRGADELAVVCDTAAYRAAIFSLSGSDACSGGMVWLQYAENSWLAPVLPSRGYIHQWQSRLISAPDFTDIPGEFSANLFVQQNAHTVYRVKDSCLADHSVRFTNYTSIGVNGVFLVIDSVSAAPAAGSYTYEFVAHHTGPSTSYFWDFSDRQNATTLTNRVIVKFDGPGIYTATVRTLGDCSEAVSKTITIEDGGDLSVGSGGSQPVQVYPNPAADQLTVTGATGAKLTLYNVIGVRVGEFMTATSPQILNVESLPPGRYILKVQYPDGRSTALRVKKQ